MLNFEEISPVALGKKIIEFTIVQCGRSHQNGKFMQIFPRRKDICKWANEWSLIQFCARRKSYSKYMHYLAAKCIEKKKTNGIKYHSDMISNWNDQANSIRKKKSSSSPSSPFSTLFIHKFWFNGGKLFFNFITHLTMVHWSITKTHSIFSIFRNNCEWVFTFRQCDCSHTTPKLNCDH